MGDTRKLGLMGLFGVQHSIMARPEFKQRWTKIIPKELERTTFVFATCVVFGLLFAIWQPLTGLVWNVESPVLRGMIWIAFVAGWGVVLYSTFLIDHFELFGLKQSMAMAFNREFRSAEFKERSLYRFVRHPLMLGFMIAFWAAPTMTVGRLTFAVVVTTYVLVALQLEERDLVRAHGEAYRRYQRRVPMLLPGRLAGSRVEVRQP